MEHDHPDLDRWWNRKWGIVIACTIFAKFLVIAAMLFAIFGDNDTAFNTYRVMSFASPIFLVPLLAYFGVSEWNNQTRMKQQLGGTREAP